MFSSIIHVICNVSRTLKDAFLHGVCFLQNGEASLFEVNIRYVGGLLSAYYLTGAEVRLVSSVLNHERYSEVTYAWFIWNGQVVKPEGIILKSKIKATLRVVSQPNGHWFSVRMSQRGRQMLCVSIHLCL